MHTDARTLHIKEMFKVCLHFVQLKKPCGALFGETAGTEARPELAAGLLPLDALETMLLRSDEASSTPRMDMMIARNTRTLIILLNVRYAVAQLQCVCRHNPSTTHSLNNVFFAQLFEPIALDYNERS